MANLDHSHTSVAANNDETISHLSNNSSKNYSPNYYYAKQLAKETISRRQSKRQRKKIDRLGCNN